MIAFEFPTTISSDKKIELPENVSMNLKPNQNVRLILLVNEPNEKQEQVAWAKLTSEQFLAGYTEADAIYDRM
ncbi:MAG: hypothetical protein KGZ58_13080 [Ignavibacteriales bacterium]|nr:hypothetical protein [Ignavibacteriales bacterium]